MSYSMEELDSALIEILQNDTYIKSIGRVSACSECAVKFFVYDLKTDNTFKIIREALIDLHYVGHFNWRKE